MANQLDMVKTRDIVALDKYGFSHREIARRLSVHRQTVSRHLRLNAESKSTPVPTGTAEVGQSKSTPAPAGSKSLCDPFRAVIEQKLRAGLTAQRIWQDLRIDADFEGGYDSVKRFVRTLSEAAPEAFRRMECAPGQEAQVDFGQGAWVRRERGRRKRPHVFRIVLSYSRKGYSESVWRQDTETFIRCLENAFRDFGGVPRTLVPDNLKAAVQEADWYDPTLTPKLEAFCRHYGTVLLPARPRTPRHKGKVESGVHYVQDNGLKDYEFASLAAENVHLDWWETHVADTRIHGTTRRQVGQVFVEEEKPALLPLPPNTFPFFQEGRRKVHRDGHIEVDKAYYSVPPEYLGRTVWVRYDGRLVRIFDERFEPIAVHVQGEPGRFCTEPNHIAPRKISMVERGVAPMIAKARRIGPHSHGWATTMLVERGIPGIRVLQGFLHLAGKHPSAELERTCAIAVRHGCYRLKTLRHLLKNGTGQGELAFMETHPVIRPLGDYQELIEQAVGSP